MNDNLEKEITELQAKVDALKSQVFQPGQPINPEKLKELRNTETDLEPLLKKQRDDEFHARYTAEIADQKRKDIVFQESRKHPVYRSSF